MTIHSCNLLVRTINYEGKTLEFRAGSLAPILYVFVFSLYDVMFGKKRVTGPGGERCRRSSRVELCQIRMDQRSVGAMVIY